LLHWDLFGVRILVDSIPLTPGNTGTDIMGMRWVKSLVGVVAALWIGIQFCVGFIVAPYLFALAARQSAVVPNTGVAAELIGPLLHTTDYISVGVGAVVLVLLVALRRGGERPLGGRYYVSEIGVLVAMVTAAVNVWMIAPRIKAVKELLAEKYGAYHLSDKSDALYAQFGQWHQTSTLLFMAGFIGSVTCVFCLTQFAPLGTTRPVR